MTFMKEEMAMDKRTAKRIRIGVEITWILILFVMLLLVQYAEVNIAAQNWVTILAKMYCGGSVIVIAILRWLKKRELPDNEK